jgi:hypothetical protein
VAHLVLSRPLLRRALLILQALTREAIRRRWEVTTYGGADSGGRSGIALTIRDHVYPLEVHELTETLPFTKDESRHGAGAGRGTIAKN